MTHRSRIVATLFALLLVAGHAAAAPSLNLVILENEGSAAHIVVGETLTLTLTIKHAGLTNPFSLPNTSGLAVNGSGSDPHSGQYTFFVTPARPGDFTVPAFDVRTGSGQALHVNALKFHVFAR
jgi:hypothetical protein